MSDPQSDPSSHDPAGLASALHERLSAPESVAELARQWRERGRLSVQPLLAPGLAAELAAFLPQLQFAPHWDHDRMQQSWRCSVAIPHGFEAQYPLAMYRLGRALATELPRLVAALCERAWAAEEPGRIDFHVFRKGSFREPARSSSAGPDAGGLEYILGLTGARWPRAWGGHLRGERDGALIESALGWDTLHLFPIGEPVAIPLVTRHVYGATVLGRMRPANPGAPARSADLE